MKHLGNLIEDQIIDFTFSTHAADGTPTSLAGNPAISVYKANSTAQTTEGVTLTVDFDSVTGLNHVRIDTSAHAFYATGNDYSVVITTGTVDGTSVVGTTLAVFSIENRYVEETPQSGDAYSPAQYARTAAMAAQTAAEAVKTIVEPDGSGDLAAIKTQTDKLSFTGTDVKATLDGEEVTPTSASKTGYALTSEERTAIAAAIEADLIDDETHQAVMAAILAKLEAGFPDLDTLTLTAIASQVRTELATELARIDAAISSRHAAGAAVAKSPATLDWSADVSNKPTIGTSTLTTSDIDARLTAYGAQKTGVAVTLPVPDAGFFANQPAVSVDVELPSSIPSGWLAAILTGKATSVVITTYLVTAGELVIEHNHDYPSSKNRAITFVNNGSFGDLTGSIPHLIIRSKGSNDIIIDSVGTINGSVNDPDSIEFDLTSEETGLLTNFSSKAYQYKVELRYTDGVVCGLIQENDCTVLW